MKKQQLKIEGRKKLRVIFWSLFLGGCHSVLLEPQIEEALSHVEVSNIPERRGQLLRQGLLGAFQRQGPRHYTLSVILEEKMYGLALSDEARSRLNHVALRGTYTLREEKEGKVIGHGVVASDNVFPITPSISSPSLYYATTVGEDYAWKNSIHHMVILLKQAIIKDLGAYLGQWKKIRHPKSTVSLTDLYPSHAVPVDPNPPSPRWDSGKVSVKSQEISDKTAEKTN